ncbi:FG-GAP repeat protein [bacterium]|nr:FG-GAP repeat protein [bacterium]
MKRWFVLLLVGAVGGICAAAEAAERTKVDGSLLVLFDAVERGRSLRELGSEAPSLYRSDGRVSVTIRFDKPLTDLEADAYEKKLGIEWMRLPNSSQIANYDRFYPAWITNDQLGALRSDTRIEFIEPGKGLHEVSTLDVSVPEIQADIRHQWPTGTNAFGNTGQGIRVADWDSGVDVTHPFFFRAEPYIRYDLVDADNNGFFTPGVDGVDLDGSGVLESDEYLDFVDSFALPGVYDTHTDWLYNDANRNGERDTGSAAGFSESDAAYGELVFYVEDTNGNHILEVGEKLAPFKESKIYKALGAGYIEYTRGSNLIDTPPDPGGHGTSVLGIVAGQELGFGRAYVGVAPGAELLPIDRKSNPNHISTLTWALTNGADVCLWEFGGWTGQYLDGSSSLEMAITQEMEGTRSVHVIPNGNLGTSDRHAQQDFTGAITEMKTQTLDIPADPGIKYLAFSLLYTGELSDFRYEIRQGTSGDWTSINPNVLPRDVAIGDDHTAYGVIETGPTVRGTVRYDMQLARNDRAAMSGNWQLRLAKYTNSDRRVHFYVADDATSWSGGAYWVDNSTPASTITWPSTADKGINVGSYSVDILEGPISGFSGRGPRIDGWANVLDIAAPGDYDILTCISTAQLGDWGYYTNFGGTSAAGPHVAAACALLWEAVPSSTPADLAAAINDSAHTDSDTGAVYNDQWGWGKLRIHDAFFELAGNKCSAISGINNISPSNNATNVDSTGTTLSWSDDPDAQLFDLHFGTTNPPELFVPGLTGNSMPITDSQLAANTTYYWRLYARNTCGSVYETPVWSFTTGAGPEPDIELIRFDESFNRYPIPLNGTVAFPDTAVGDSNNIVMLVKNNGAADLHLTGTPTVQFSGLSPYDFTATPPNPLVYAGGAENAFTMTFEPFVGGHRMATVSIPNDDPDESPYTFYVTGIGIAPTPTPSPTPTASPTPSPTPTGTAPPTIPPMPTAIDLSQSPGQEGHPLTRIYGESDNDALGGDYRSTIAMGDFNGDGYDDLLIGATGNASDIANRPGRAFLIAGDGTLPLLDELSLHTVGNSPPSNITVIEGDANNARCGTSVATGDFNGDGYDDALVGVPGYDPVRRSSELGGAFLLFGNANVFGQKVTAAPGQAADSVMLTTGITNGETGNTVAAGDINGDGFTDAIYASRTAPSADGSVIFTGAIQVEFGSATFPSRRRGTVDNTAIIHGDDQNDQLGFALATGDVDGDGYDDLILTSRNGEFTAIVFGDTITPGAKIDLNTDDTISALGETRIFGDDFQDKFGYSAATGDLDGDGLADVIVGAPEARGPTNSFSDDNSGEVYVFWGDQIQRATAYSMDTDGAISTMKETRIFGDDGGFMAGVSVAAGDITGDGLSDLVVGSPGTTGNQSSILYGDQLPKNTTVLLSSVDHPDVEVFGAEALDHFGASSNAAGDMNGDGIADAAIGSHAGVNPNLTSGMDESGYAALLYGGGDAVSATVIGHIKDGAVPRRGIGGHLAPVSRALVGFLGGTGTGVTTLIHRGDGDLSGLGVGPEDTADVYWHIQAERQNAGQMLVEFSYRDVEIQDQEELLLNLFFAPSVEGPWFPVGNQYQNMNRNTIGGEVSLLDAYFALSDAQPEPLDLTDSDGDGFSDAIEKSKGTDPDDPTSRPDFGDYNTDGIVNTGDAVAFYRALSKNGGTLAYDVNLDIVVDLEVNYDDAQALYDWAIGGSPETIPISP